MRNKTIKSLLLPALCFIAANGQAQGTLEDYRRAYSLYEKFNATQVYNDPADIRWDGKTAFHYSVYTPEGTDYYVGKVTGDVKTADVKAIHMKALAELLSRETGKDIPRNTLRLSRLSVDENQPTSVSFEFDGYKWKVEEACTTGLRLGNKEALPSPKGPWKKPRHWMEVDDEKGAAPVVSPDGKRQAYIKNDNVYVSDRDGRHERALSNDGTAGNYYSSWLKWSPDGRYVCANKIRPAQKRYVYYVESSPKSQLQPILHQQEYAKPGDELRFKVPCIFNVETGQAVIPSTELFDRQYDLYGPEWKEDGKAVTFEYNERGHKTYRVLELDAETGKVRTLVEESSPTFVNYSRMFRHVLKGGKEMIWMSERDNWNHLYMIDLEKGKVARQITKGEWVVRRVLKVDEDNQVIYFTASGVNPKEDPYHVHYYKINMDGKQMTCLTPEEGNHSAVFNEDYTLWIDKYSTAEQAPVTVLRTAQGEKTEGRTLAQADLSKIKSAGWTAPETFTAPGRDGVTPMWGIIQRPTNFDPQKKYPVIEYIYSGPGDAYTPKSFLPYNGYTTALAELGFIVVQLDAMGTSYRGKKFEEVCYKNLKDAGFPDRIQWIKAAAEKYPYMDSTRVGIYGCSAGGQEALAAVLFHPEFYKASYSSCGCHDNRMDKIWWNEQWMGYPVDSSYIACSNVENAHRLTRPLMLVVGEMDDNVDPASTMQVVDALIKADKDFELVVLPGVRHSMGESYGEHKRFDFFVKELMGVEPPKWEELKQK
ncbi:peptidase, S9A/B/C family, catalytic domain protein [Paraprevotella xylaniphila YIT 11841]|uniref:Peptidase, S9A/B/C family, catalytic domain protein n=1 Tax=Paraprevotella xylaniphila YIT 11841 TaxID=762982 RepID=F3QRV6_9BACT|nr:S9 family peptidase [Paraprevotella xylaniphila]EGG55819.1 peptidase, S9A/B/C family, catalytic domain protein [Paraprevotella xylaniphila YIT 11841]